MKVHSETIRAALAILDELDGMKAGRYDPKLGVSPAATYELRIAIEKEKARPRLPSAVIYKIWREHDGDIPSFVNKCFDAASRS